MNVYSLNDALIVSAISERIEALLEEGRISERYSRKVLSPALMKLHDSSLWRSELVAFERKLAKFEPEGARERIIASRPHVDVRYTAAGREFCMPYVLTKVTTPRSIYFACELDYGHQTGEKVVHGICTEDGCFVPGSVEPCIEMDDAFYELPALQSYTREVIEAMFN